MKKISDKIFNFINFAAFHSAESVVYGNGICDCHKFVISIGEQMNFYVSYFRTFYCGSIFYFFSFSFDIFLECHNGCERRMVSNFNFAVYVCATVGRKVHIRKN